MDTKPSKPVPKKSSSTEKSSAGKKCTTQKKKKKHKRKSEAKETGKSSTSPEQDVGLSDTVQERESDNSSTVVKQKTIHIRQTTTKYSEALATLKQSHRKPSTKSPSKPQNTPKSTATVPCNTIIKKLTNANAKTTTATATVTKPQPNNLRWENELNDLQSEEERLKMYKLNRRKRYITEAKHDYSEWLASGVTGDGSVNIQDTSTEHPGVTNSRKTTTTRLHIQEKVVPSSVDKIVPQRISSFKSHNQDIMVNC